MFTPEEKQYLELFDFTLHTIEGLEIYSIKLNRSLFTIHCDENFVIRYMGAHSLKKYKSFTWVKKWLNAQI